MTPTWTYDDGGSSLERKDCAVRAIAIAREVPYGAVCDELAPYIARERPRTRKRSHVHRGVRRVTIRRYLAAVGWQWIPTMGIRTGCRVHLRGEELPPGRLIVAVSKHMTAVIDGVIHDRHDPSRNGTRCVYGYWEEGNTSAESGRMLRCP